MLPGGGDHGDAPGSRELDGEDADAAARALDQQGLARPGVQPVQRAVGGLAQGHQRGGGLEGDLRRLGDGPQRQADLVRLLDPDAATTARTVRRLEQTGLLRRYPCADDKRAYLIEATTASHALREQVESLWHQLEDATSGNLSPAEQADVLHVLEALESRLTRAAARRGA